jgi:hypothetical protein
LNWKDRKGKFDRLLLGGDLLLLNGCWNNITQIMEVLIKSCAIEMTCAFFNSREEKKLEKIYFFSKIHITIE